VPIPQHEARRILQLPADQTICLFFGTHREGKDYATAIQAAKSSSSQPFLLFVGPLISANDPAALLASIGYANSDSRTGYYPDAQVGMLFDAADAVMLPYGENYTKGSAVLLQACHFHKPVIASNTGHLREFVENNGNGALYAPGSIEELSACYDRLFCSKADGTVTATWSFQTAHNNYSWGKLLPHYLRIFNISKHL
jgi:glycosyltransferase involved in cell wall biosynthesis